LSPYLLALLAALAFALGTVLQQRGTLQTSAEEGDPRFLAEIIRKPVWLLGGSLQVCGWVLQAAALDRGSLAVVQSLCALSLVFALPLGVRLTGQHIGRRSIIGACATLVGIVFFITVGQPQGGTSQPAAASWWFAGLVIVGLMIVLAWQARRRRGAVSAALFATAAGLSFGFQAAVTKVFVNQIGYGLGVILSSWTTYALILSALAGFALQQSALKTGFLAPAMAASNASTLAVSVLLGVTLFQETLSSGQGRLPPAIFGIALAIVGVVLLAAPAPMNPEVATE
jgi:drug/metabolite transporter (DMT)-like permease